METKLLEQRTRGGEPSKLPYNLISQITNNFDNGRILGSGGFGTVYKGVYEDGTEIAVKVLHSISGVDDKEFHKEFDNLRGLKHPNIVELVGFCHEWEEELVVYEGKQVAGEHLRMALCFEYVHKGSLNKLISDEKTGFTWHTRYRIIKGISEGLKYLREGLEHPIMHFDLKPDNILLDKSMLPKIADFGLSELFGEENTKKAMSSVGTCGYWPPEYIKHQIISREFDIFSLGVIIVRIMTGHEHYNSIVEMPRRKSVKLVHERWRNMLSGTLSHTSLEVYCNQVKKCIEIALDCMISNRQERPTIQDIVSILNETETIRGDQGMHNEQFDQDDGESTLISDMSSITINSRSSSENFRKAPRVMPLSLLKEMTDDFSEARLAGKGGYGRVYKGIHGDGQVVAVKMFYEYLAQSDNLFHNELEILTKVHHPNIVQFIGYCHETSEVVVQYEGKHVISEERHKVLCFEYLPGGSLDKYIPRDIDSAELDWKTQYGIIKGICEGLKYLHEGLKRPIIHMDLKPGNILLDDKMIPKIADFGLSRLFGVENTHRTMGPIVGTLGYMPPEFIEKQVISKEFDIYSLGVLILMVMTGKESYHEFLNMPHQRFIDLALRKWRESLQKMVDIKSVERYGQQVKKCLEIAVTCVDHDRHNRPAIGDIILMLNETETRLILQLDSELLDVHPHELQFMASTTLDVLRKKKKAMISSSCSLRLDNKGNDCIAFMLVAKSTNRYLTKEPFCGIVPPRCAHTLILTIRNNKQPPSSSSSSSMDSDIGYFTLYSVAVGEYDLLNVDKDTICAEYDDFLKKAKEKSGHEVQEVRLNVICGQQQADPGTSSEPTQPTVEIITTSNAQQVSSIDVHPTEPWTVTTNRVGILRGWNHKTMATLNSIQDITDEPVHVAKFIAREKWIVAGDCRGWIHVHNYDENEEVESFGAHNSCITTLAVHPTDPFLLSSSDDADHLIKLWDWDKYWECIEFQGHVAKVTQVTFDPNDSSSFASASLDGTVKIWSICSDDPTEIITLKLEEQGLSVDYFTRYNQQHLIVGCKNRNPQIWKLETKERVHELEGHTNLISVANLHPELPILITGSLDGTVRIWNSTTYKLDNIISCNLGAVYAFRCITGSRRIVIGCHQGIAMMDIPLP